MKITKEQEKHFKAIGGKLSIKTSKCGAYCFHATLKGIQAYGNTSIEAVRECIAAYNREYFDA